MRSHADVPDGRHVAVRRRQRASRRRPTSPTSRAPRRWRTCYGKPFTGAESMTAFHRPWSYTPRRLKHVADLELALGVTRFCIHTSPHQPTQVPPPGIGLAPVPRAGVHPHRALGRARRAVDRLPRPLLVAAQPGTSRRSTSPSSSARRRRSRPCSVTQPDRTRAGRVRLRLRRPRRPGARGSPSAAAAWRRATSSYRLLYLGGSQLADDRAGAPRSGCAGRRRRHGRRPPPGRVRRPWRTTTPSTRASATGSGAPVACGTPMTWPRCCPSWACADPRRRRRRGPADRPADRGGELHFLAEPAPRSRSAWCLSTPDGQPLIAWDPVTLRRAALSDTGTGHRLDLPALGSVFLLPGGHADEARRTVAERHLDGAWRLALPGVLDDELPAGPVPWTDLGGKAAGFAGTGTYTTEVDMEHRLLEGHAVVLELGDVGDLARVRVNGVDAGHRLDRPLAGRGHRVAAGRSQPHRGRASPTPG